MVMQKRVMLRQICQSCTRVERFDFNHIDSQRVFIEKRSFAEGKDHLNIYHRGTLVILFVRKRFSKSNEDVINSSRESWKNKFVYFKFNNVYLENNLIRKLNDMFVRERFSKSNWDVIRRPLHKQLKILEVK